VITALVCFGISFTLFTLQAFDRI